MMEKKVFACPGSCGELFQGVIDGVTVHITCPIDKYSRVQAELSNNGRLPAWRVKTAKAVANWLQDRGLGDTNIEFTIESELPTGKGMASSTADIAAALAAAAHALQQEITTEEIATAAVAVEPTDGVFFPGIAVFDHHQGSVVDLLSPAPLLGIIVLEFGGVVDSLDFASASIKYTRQERDKLAEAFSLVKYGIVRGDLEALGIGSTMSAEINQKYLSKPALDKVVGAAKEISAYGVNIAHSGTVIGIIAAESIAVEATSYISAKFPEAHVFNCRLVNGGVRRSKLINDFELLNTSKCV